MYSYLKNDLPNIFNDFLPSIGIYTDMQPEIQTIFMYQFTDIIFPDL